MKIPITVQLENNYKYKTTALYPLIQEIYDSYAFAFSLQTTQIINKLENEIRNALNQYYPRLENIDGINVQATSYGIKLYFTEKFINEMELLYPEALI